MLVATDEVKATHPALADGIRTALERGDVGVQVAVWGPDGLVAEGWGGHTDTSATRPVDADTLFPVYSVTKGITAAALQVQVARGLLSLDDLVVEHWPEYGQSGKEATTVLDVVTHRAGLTEMPDDATPEHTADWDWMVERLAGMTPVYPPGTTNAYHSVTWGWLVGELVRRTDPAHRPFCAFLQQELFDPLGIDDAYMVLPPAEDDRVATVSGQIFWPRRPVVDLVEGSVGPGNYRSCSPSGGLVTTARATARYYAMLANGGELDGVRILPEELVLAALEPRPDALADDATADRVRYIGRGGWWLGGEAPPAEPLVAFGRRMLWHPGLGGSTGLADLDRGVGAVICHNRLFRWEAVPRDEHPLGAITEAVDALTE